MGRSKKNKRKRGQGSHHQSNRKPNNHGASSKRRKQGRFWIEDCQDTTAPKGVDCKVEVLITRVELFDDYTQAPKPKDNTNNGGSEIAAEAKVTHEVDVKPENNPVQPLPETKQAIEDSTEKK